MDLNALKKHGLAPEFLAAHAVEFPEAVAAYRAFVDDRTLVAHGMENKDQGRMGSVADAGTIMKLPTIPMGDVGALLRCVMAKVAFVLQYVFEVVSSVGTDMEWQLLRRNVT